MNEMLPQILADLNLQPGQSHRVQVNGYHIEIRRPVEEAASSAVMLQAWVEFPRLPGTPIEIQAGKLPFPDPPDIAADFAENES